jgi:hypothetical protein
VFAGWAYAFEKLTGDDAGASDSWTAGDVDAALRHVLRKIGDLNLTADLTGGTRAVRSVTSSSRFIIQSAASSMFIVQSVASSRFIVRSVRSVTTSSRFIIRSVLFAAKCRVRVFRLPAV